MKHKVLFLFARDVKAFRDWMSGALRFAAQTPAWDVRVLDVGSSRFSEDAARALDGWNPDAILYMNGKACKRIVDTFRLKGCLLAGIDDREPGVLKPSVHVIADNAAISRFAADFLIERGYRNLAYFGTDKAYEQTYSREREAAFRKTADRAGRTYSSLLPPVGGGWSDLLHEVSNWVAGLSKPCGIMAYCDESARFLLDACRFARVKVPEQVAIIGVDDDSNFCETSNPPITSVLPEFEKAGFLAASLLNSAFRRKAKSHPTRKYGVQRLIERSSTIDVRGGGRLVNAINEMIREKNGAHLSIAEMARSLNASPRLIQLRYKEITGRTIRETVKLSRLEKVCDLLTQTDLPISEICASCGFATITNAQILFKRQYGVSMSAWRT